MPKRLDLLQIVSKGFLSIVMDCREGIIDTLFSPVALKSRRRFIAAYIET